MVMSCACYVEEGRGGGRYNTQSHSNTFRSRKSVKKKLLAGRLDKWLRLCLLEDAREAPLDNDKQEDSTQAITVRLL